MATVAPALFQTRCSACDAIQTVTPEALKTQSGLLRCSECGATFNAAWSLVDQIPNPARLNQLVTARPDPALPEFESGLYGDSSARPLRNVDQPFGDQQPSNGPAGRKEPVLFVDDNESQRPLGSAPSQAHRPQKAVRTAWGLPFAGVVLAVLALLAQVRFPLLEAVASVDTARPALALLCRYTACQLPAPTNGPEVSVVQSELDLHRYRPDALVLRIHLMNHSDALQDYPALEVTLNSAAGEVIGRRTYLPREFGVTEATGKLQNGRNTVVTLMLAEADAAISGAAARTVRP
tara:strand:+ start:2723 stop:3601 length:879 start_codon:yes stop_codon:yes gene_type:complete